MCAVCWQIDCHAEVESICRRAGSAPLPDEAATVFWKTNQVVSRPGHNPINAGTGSHKAKSLNEAAIYVMEELEESRRDNSWIVKADGTRFDLPISKQIYAKLKSK